MGHSSDEDTNLSESEVEDYIDDVYRRLKKEIYEVKISTDKFRCPFCPGKRKQEYVFNDLLQHAEGIGKSSRGKLKERGNHKALRDYLKKYHSPLSSIKAPENSSSKATFDRTEKFVWPWKGILANLPIRREDRRYVGESGSKQKGELKRKGFNPAKVKPLWSCEGHSGFAVVYFQQDYMGFANAMSFDVAFETEKRGRRDWHTSRSRGNDLYGWVAKEADYNSSGILGKHLRENGDRRTIEEVELEDDRMAESLVSNLTETSKSKDEKCIQVQSKLQETNASLTKVIQEKDSMTEDYNEEMLKIQQMTMENTRKIFDEHAEFKMKLQYQKEQLERREKELKSREANYENEVVELRHLRKRNDMASTEQKKADENVLRLLEEQKREKEELHKKIISLQDDIDTRQALELDIELLKGLIQVKEQMGREAETKKEMEKLNEDLKEKEGDLQYLEDLAQTLIVKERRANDELQEARKELVTELSKETRTARATIGVKSMGALDVKVFDKAAKDKYPSDHVRTKAEELMAICRSHIEDHDWHPFKIITENGVPKEVINEDEDRLKRLRNDLGEDAWRAMVTAMSELNEYNPSGLYPVPELWHQKEGRKATLQEGVECILAKWKTKKRK